MDEDKAIYKLIDTFGMSRGEIINDYTRFEDACQLTAGKYRMEDLNIWGGISFDVFRFGIPEMALEQKEFVYKLFKLANVDDVNERMSWDNFFIAVKALENISKSHNIDYMFNLIAGNDPEACFTYKQVVKVCHKYFNNADPGLR